MRTEHSLLPKSVVGQRLRSAVFGSLTLHLLLCVKKPGEKKTKMATRTLYIILLKCVVLFSCIYCVNGYMNLFISPAQVKRLVGEYFD